MTARDDVAANLATCAELAAEAAGRGVRLLLLPECFPFLGARDADKLAVAEVIDAARPGPILAALIDLARSYGMWIIGGGMPERRGEPSAPTKVYNACVAVAPDGTLAAVYRKIHLFDVDIPGGAQLRESDSTHRGEERPVLSTPFARVGLSICYDLRFPELYRELVRGGAEVLVVPSAFTAHTGAAHWHVLLRARAIENQCYVVAAAQSGQHNERRATYGHSMIVDPWGTIVAELPTGTGLAVAAIDPDVLEKTRRQMPCLDHRVL
jgi:predicted amidohydrolase